MPLYDAICRRLAVSTRAADILDAAAPGQRRPVLLLAAIHDLLLEQRSTGLPLDALGEWYPTVSAAPRSAIGGDAGSDLSVALESFLDTHHVPLTTTVAGRTTQTNEPNRCAAWNLGMAAATSDLADRAVAWIELGASAGLNLAFDRHAYDFSREESDTPPVGGREGTADRVLIRCRPRGDGQPPIDGVAPPINVRFGVDIEPVQLDDPARRRWLAACIWPEQTERVERFDAALADRLAHPVEVRRGDAIDIVGTLADELPADLHVIVAHSWMLTYIKRDRRARLDDALTELARDRPVSWLSVEAPGVVDAVAHQRSPLDHLDDVGHFSHLGMTTFRRDGRRDVLLARCHPHLRWIEWLDAGDRLLG